MAIKAITLAKKIVMDYYRGDFNIKIKSDNSEVTDADIASNNIILKTLQEHFSNYAYLSEELKDDKTRLSNDYCFIIDPLDGTKDFVNHTDTFAINIALSYKHEIVLGLIMVPVFDVLYYAIKGQGAFKVENGITTKINVAKNEDNLILVCSNFFFKDKDKFENNHLISKIMNVGSSYKSGLIAEGKANICYKSDPNSKEWDTAPIEIIIKEAGGAMSDVYGKQIKYNKDDVYNRNGFIVASSKSILDKFIIHEKEC